MQTIRRSTIGDPFCSCVMYLSTVPEFEKKVSEIIQKYFELRIDSTETGMCSAPGLIEAGAEI